MNSKLFEKNVKTSSPDLKSFRVQPVLISQMKPAPSGAGQREQSPAWVDFLVAHMDLNAIGQPVLNRRGDVFLICDGQHRIEALKRLGFDDYAFDCRVYEDLTDGEMATMFLKLNKSKPVDTYSKFMNAVSAGYKAETDVKKVVEACGLRFSRAREDGSIGAVAACMKVYHGQGDVILKRTLTVLSEAFEREAKAFDARVIPAMGLVLGRYNGKVHDKRMIEALIPLKQGVVGINRIAEQTRLRVGSERVLCTAATLVDIYNKGQRGSEKVPSWWQEAQ